MPPGDAESSLAHAYKAFGKVAWLACDISLGCGRRVGESFRPAVEARMTWPAVHQHGLFELLHLFEERVGVIASEWKARLRIDEGCDRLLLFAVSALNEVVVGREAGEDALEPLAKVAAARRRRLSEIMRAVLFIRRPRRTCCSG
jgi:hypothetical protein